jgi:hypothetical protein
MAIQTDFVAAEHVARREEARTQASEVREPSPRWLVKRGATRAGASCEMFHKGWVEHWISIKSL